MPSQRTPSTSSSVASRARARKGSGAPSPSSSRLRIKPKARKLVPVTVAVDPVLKKLYAEALRRLERASAEGAQAWDVRYEVISDILEHQPPLYLAGGYSSDAQFFAKHVGEDRASVYRNIRVARYATPSDIELYTSSRLDRAITWLETKNGGPLAGRNPIDFSKLRIPVLVRDGDSSSDRSVRSPRSPRSPRSAREVVAKPLSELSVADLNDAIALLKGREAASKKSSPEARAVAQSLQNAKVKGVTFQLRRGVLVLRVPLEQVVQTGKALAAYRPPNA
jgi:hypothetical protein